VLFIDLNEGVWDRDPPDVDAVEAAMLDGDVPPSPATAPASPAW
jgi:hypothetical protein